MNTEWMPTQGESPFAHESQWSQAGESSASFEQAGEAVVPGWAASPFASGEAEWAENERADSEWMHGEWPAGETSEAPWGEAAPAGKYESEFLLESGEAWETESPERWAEVVAESNLGEFETFPGEAPGWSQTPFAHETRTAARCGDAQYGTTRWTVNRPGRHDSPQGSIDRQPPVPRAEVTQSALADFDIDDYRLRPAHHTELDSVVAAIGSRLGGGQYLPVVHIQVRGEASSTATNQHNLALSRHRAWNVVQHLRCRLQGAGLGVDKVVVTWTPIGESVGQTLLGDNRESAEFRRVRLTVIAPIPGCSCPPAPAAAPCNCTTVPPGQQRPPAPRVPGLPWRPPGRRLPPRPHGTSTTMCVTVPSIAPRSARARPAQRFPLGSVVPGLPASVAVIANGRASVHIRNASSGNVGQFELRGWGLEVALPQRANVDITAQLRATLDVVARAAGSLSGNVQIGPFGLSLKADGSVFAQALVQLVAQLRLRLGVSFAPNIPDLTTCAPLQARKRNSPVGINDLAGPALLIVPGRGLGPAAMHFASPGVAMGQVQLSANPVRVPADKRTVRTLLAIGGVLQLVRTTRTAGEAELEAESNEAGEFFDEVSSAWHELEAVGAESAGESW